MKLRVEVVALDCLMVRLFDEIAESNMPWMLAASESLRTAFAGHLIDLVPSYTTLMVHYDLTALSPAQARELIAQALIDLSPNARTRGTCHVLPVWYDVSVGPELSLLSQRSGLAVEEVIRRHCEREYQVFALGFAPGFAFMGLVEEVLAVCLRAAEAPAIQAPRLLRKTALRGARPHAPAREIPVVDAGEAVDRVSLGHGRTLLRVRVRPCGSRP